MAKEIDIEEIRSQFPALQRIFSGHPLGYLDNAATVQKPLAVLEAMNNFYANHYSNVHRASYDLSHEASSMYESARERVAAFLGAKKDEIIFQRSATEAINTVALSWGRKNISAGDTIVVTEMEHHANIVPWHMLAKEAGASLLWVGLRQDGTLDRDAFVEALQCNPKIVALTHVSNVLGTVNPIEDLIEESHGAGALVLVDGAQAVARINIDFKKSGADFYVFSGHKIYGPTGIGVLCCQRDLLLDMPPAQGGGGMISCVGKEEIIFREPPWRFEAGTPPIAEAVGLSAALDWLESVGVEKIRAHEQDLSNRLYRELAAKENIFLPGPKTREAIVSFEIAGIHAHDTAEILNRLGLALRAGHHCAQVLVRALDTPALVRASFAAYNSQEEVDRLLEGIEATEAIFH